LPLVQWHHNARHSWSNDIQKTTGLKWMTAKEVVELWGTGIEPSIDLYEVHECLMKINIQVCRPTIGW